jgi:UDP-glucose 4-epimerase
MERILITGGSGFIGGYVYRHLRDYGYNAINYDIVENNNDSAFIRGSILDFDAVKRGVEKTDIIFHFAGFSNINHVKAHPRDCIELNIIGTTNFLEAIRLKGEGKFIFASSVYVHNTNGHFYTASKLASEIICENYSKLYGIPIVILRLGTVYGEKSRHEDVVSIFVKKACAGYPIIIHGSGEQKRHFIHGEDVAVGCKIIIEKGIINAKLVLAGKRCISIKELSEIVKNNIKGVIIQNEGNLIREDDYQGDIGDLERTFKELEWEPEIDIKRGVKRLIKYFQERYKDYEKGTIT